jgi:hypothetical protein
MTAKDNNKTSAQGMLATAEHLASTVKEKASELGGNVSEKANAAVSNVGETMTGLAGALRDKAPAAVAPYVEKAAAGLEHTGAYLKKGTVGELVDDFSSLIHRHPVPVLLTGVAVGFLMARKLEK